MDRQSDGDRIGSAVSNPFAQDPVPIRRRLWLRRRVLCRVCHRSIAGMIPRGGRLPHPARHKGIGERWCAGRYFSADLPSNEGEKEEK